MEAKNQPPWQRHGSHRSTDAKPEAGHLASSLEFELAEANHTHLCARSKREHFQTESSEDVPRSRSSATAHDKPVSILEESSVMSQPRRSGVPAMHTILEFRASKPSSRTMDKSNNNDDFDNCPLVNGIGRPAKTWPTVLIGGPLKTSSSRADNDQVTSAVNCVGRSPSINGPINGNIQNQTSSKTWPSVVTGVPLKTGSPHTDNDQVVTSATNGVGRAPVINGSINGNVQNHGPSSKTWPTVVTGVPLKTGTSHGDNEQMTSAVNGVGRSSSINGAINGTSNGTINVNNQNQSPSKKAFLQGSLDGSSAAQKKTVATNNRRNSLKEGRFEANIVLAQSMEKTRLGSQKQKAEGKPERSNGQYDVTTVSLAELCRRDSRATVDRAKQSDEGSTRSWSLRSDMSSLSLSDSEEEDTGFFLQENASAEDGMDDDVSSVASFAGRRNYLMPEKVICGVTGTVRGMRNRVRAGIATFVQPANNITKNFSQLENSKVVVYTTSNGIVRETFQKCLKVKTILSTFLVPFEERDIFKSRAYQRELVDRLTVDHIAVPQVFVEGHYLGDADIIEDLNEQGKLRKILRPYKRPGALIPCQKCGGYKLLLCNACNGSKKSVRRNCFTESLGSMRCSKCDECGLIQCDLCCRVQRDDNLINT